ncbi:hypothetical protein MPL1_03533 [Methylophaga lonarensis MPL]|uniref:Transporter n=1 Tax=Methylophaga lonarensis MPL TaxID=1286106 RepID=M7PTI5_9GAMM|nr:DUF502 domain-containing protein [Methylophaga lonarensis]EMR13754.1 hypothetical protein MPL1_03533 [Methylophaga lonarensis MPL]
MQFVWGILLKGLAAVLPVGLTLYFIYWLSLSIERLMHPLLDYLIPGEYYWPGLGLLTGLMFLFLIGLAVNAWLIQRILGLGEYLLSRIPLIKSIYGAIRDFTDFFANGQQRQSLSNAVAVEIGGVRLLGFKVQDNVDDVLPEQADQDLIAVYLPMSYQIGGYTVCLPRSSVIDLEMGNEETMRWILTAGLSKSEKSAQQHR